MSYLLVEVASDSGLGEGEFSGASDSDGARKSPVSPGYSLRIDEDSDYDGGDGADPSTPAVVGMQTEREEREADEAAVRVAAPDTASAQKLSVTERIEIFAALLGNMTKMDVQPHRNLAQLEGSGSASSYVKDHAVRERAPQTSGLHPGQYRTKPAPRPVGPTSRPEPDKKSSSEQSDSAVAKKVKDISDLKIPSVRKPVGLEDTAQKRERTAILAMFDRSNGSVGAQNFRRLAYLCGIPLCSAQALYIAVNSYDNMRQAKNGRRTPRATSGEASVSFAQFTKFYKEQLIGWDPESRLFNVLRKPKDRAVHVRALEAIISVFLSELFRSKRQDKKLPKSYIGTYAKIGTAVVAFGIHAGRRTFVLRELKRAGLCKALLRVERGRNEGLLEGLKLEYLERVRREFSIAAGGSSTSAKPLTLKDLTMYSAERGLLTPLCMDLVFARYCNGKEMDVFQFTQFLMSVGDPYGLHSSEYLLPIIDADMNGKVSMEDALTIFKEKKRILFRRRVQMMDFDSYWAQLRDQVQALDPEQGEELALNRREIILSSLRVRSFVIRSLLLVNEAVDVADISGSVGDADLEKFHKKPTKHL
ncbi:hypothetical protein NDN08_000201 [Rhodosorus marinus]|uniref:Calmodulin n=1 Tax=Rhodosorus marinus TaxID=101924 RepID=A0AAV8UHV0_9RHOD|nr:hypothetical protein NDN08_000201 [Rhodosorus marinus]